MQKLYGLVRRRILSYPGVTEGQRFGKPAFYFSKRFFCHCHVGSAKISLETFVFDKVDQVVESIPGVVLHPQYHAQAWVRLPLGTMSDLTNANALLDITYRYLKTIKRMSVPKTPHNYRLLGRIPTEFPDVSIRARQSAKRIQVQVEVRDLGSLKATERGIAEVVQFIRKKSK